MVPPDRGEKFDEGVVPHDAGEEYVEEEDVASGGEHYGVIKSMKMVMKM